MTTRRLFVKLSAATIALPFASVRAQNEYTRLIVFNAPGATTDRVARKFADEIGKRFPNGPRVIVDNHPGLARESFNYRAGRDLYAFSGETLRQLHRQAKVSFDGFFTAISSLGTSRCSLVSSTQSGIESIESISRLRGTIRLPEPTALVEGPRKNLAVLMVLGELAPKVRVERWTPSTRGISFANVIQNSEIDLAVLPVDALSFTDRTAHVLISNPTDGERSSGPQRLEDYTSNLPVNDELVLAVDRSWSESDIQAFQTITRDVREPFMTSVRTAVPSMQQSQLSSGGLYEHYRSFINRELVRVHTNYVGCETSVNCRATQSTNLTTFQVNRTRGVLGFCGPDDDPRRPPQQGASSPIPGGITPRMCQSVMTSSRRPSVGSPEWREHCRQLEQRLAEANTQGQQNLVGLALYANACDRKIDEDSAPQPTKPGPTSN